MCIQRKVTYSSLININLGEDDIRELFGELDELGADDLAGTAPLSVEVDSDLYEGKPKQKKRTCISHIVWLVRKRVSRISKQTTHGLVSVDKLLEFLKVFDFLNHYELYKDEKVCKESANHASIQGFYTRKQAELSTKYYWIKRVT